MNLNPPAPRHPNRFVASEGSRPRRPPRQRAVVRRGLAGLLGGQRRLQRTPGPRPDRDDFSDPSRGRYKYRLRPGANHRARDRRRRALRSPGPGPRQADRALASDAGGGGPSGSPSRARPRPTKRSGGRMSCRPRGSGRDRTRAPASGRPAHRRGPPRAGQAACRFRCTV